MPNFKSALCQLTTGYRPPITPSQSGEVKAVRGKYTVPNTLAQNDIIELVPLPAGCVPVDVIIDSDDLDSAGPTITLTAAIINSGGTDIVAGTNFITASTVGQAGGIARMDQKTGPRVASSSSTRNVGIKVAAAATTPAQGEIGLTLFYRAADINE